MVLKVLPTGMFGSNCYIIGENGEGIIIDAGADAGEIMNAVGEAGLTIKYVILTHGHVDHIRSADKLRERTGAPVLVHEADGSYLTDPELNVSDLCGMALVLKKADRLLKDGDTVKAGGLDFEVIHTPGHTPGGVCIKVNNLLFTGDTLFRASIGRSDLPGGSGNQLVASINDRLMVLEESTVVYPGHGPTTTIGHEKKNNPYL